MLLSPSVSGLALTVQCEQPNSNIHHFHGLLFCSGREVRVDSASFLLRGSSLRNTDWILGVVVYTGGWMADPLP